MKQPLSYLMGGLLTLVTMPFIFLQIPTLAQTSSEEIKLVAGNEVGEYYSIAKDIEKLGKENNLDIDVIATRGALQNIHDVFMYESVPLGIIQSDVLAFLNIFGNYDEEIRVKAESLRTVLPLYKEEIHLITRKDIKSIQDLAGKRVSIGDEGSGTSMTASTLLYQWEISPKELVTYDIKRGIHELRNGKIDALFYVVGVPAKVLQEQISPEDNFHILPLILPTASQDEFYTRLYSKTVLPANTYSWQTEPIETLAVQSFLFTVENDDCSNITPVASLIKNNLAWLQKNGNPIWKEVDFKILQNEELGRMSKCVKP
ncbi:TAXI family TRAP transporter solute-binding subunit [Geminocystis sp. NIES-3709]|uniref:TAXI family TRAP transporter solute-binding subunit n=1 Tax=Geminocystis sp. NIES-3709 TaxID=1617448 RepID=UPI0005FCC71A|nr:TAXI family TRAP transporter solute-binding subunit [Geminocystis sp. NIES-3709]BAQ65421.1 immunogenic protein [Geminocystis sp. NIES-3709]